jgi:hypothetical protein
MIDFHSTLVSALQTILPTYYEMILHSGTETPCISYMELNNADDATGDTVGYSKITYQIKVWADNIADLQRYTMKIDKVIRPLGFRRISSGELYDNNSSMMQKILTYEALAVENYYKGD